MSRKSTACLKNDGARFISSEMKRCFLRRRPPYAGRACTSRHMAVVGHTPAGTGEQTALSSANVRLRDRVGKFSSPSDRRRPPYPYGHRYAGRACTGRHMAMERFARIIAIPGVLCYNMDIGIPGDLFFSPHRLQRSQSGKQRFFPEKTICRSALPLQMSSLTVTGGSPVRSAGGQNGCDCLPVFCEEENDE